MRAGEPGTNLISCFEGFMVDLAEILKRDALDKRELINSLPAAEIVAELPLILSDCNESVACKALEILKLVCESTRDPLQSRLMVSAALYAFENGSPDVHARAMDLLKRFSLPLDPVFADELRQRLNLISSSQLPAAEALLATADGDKPVSPREFVLSTGSIDLDDLIQQLSLIEDKWRKIAGCDFALDAAVGKRRLIPATTFEALDVIRLDPATRPKPLRDPDETLDILMRGFNMQLSEAEIERVLDGVAHSPKPPSEGDYWEARLSALHARAKKDGGFLSAVALAWAFGIEPEKEQFFENLVHKRVISVANLLASGRKVNLLATPTHAGFWIDPRELVQRVSRLDDIDNETSLLEQVQSLLRVAPEHREEALSDAAHLKGEFASALRYALGSEDEIYGENIPLWVAAFRARSPLREPFCMKIKLSARSYPHISRCLNPQSYNSPGAILIEDYLRSRPGTHEQMALIGDMDIGNIKSPLCTEVFWARQFREVSESRDSTNNYWQEDGWEQLYDPDLPVGDMAIHALVYALNAVCSEARSVSVKILNRAIQDGRVDGVTIGTTIADHKSDLLSTLWLEGLQNLALASPLHAQVVHNAMEIILSSCSVTNESADPIFLAALLMLSKKIGFGIASDTARNYLHSIASSGNNAQAAAGLAKELLQLPHEGVTKNSRDAGLLALRERIKRATRWQAWHRATLVARSRT
jgi:hypothetical protein